MPSVASRAKARSAPALFGFFPWNVELVVLVDRVRGIEIVGRAQGDAHHLHELVTTPDALDAFARRAGFPEHGLVLRPDGEDDLRVRKGLVEWPVLHAAFDEALARSRSGAVFVESDLRAHMNPTRMLGEPLLRDARQRRARLGGEHRMRVKPFDAFLMQPGVVPCRFIHAIIGLRNVFALHAGLSTPGTVIIGNRLPPPRKAVPKSSAGFGELLETSRGASGPAPTVVKEKQLD